MIFHCKKGSEQIEYQLAKLNLLTKGEKTDTFIYCKDSEAVSNWVEELSLERNYKAFSLKGYNYPEPEYLKGEHNKINVLASLLASKSLGFCEEKAIETAMNFKGLNHRLQFVGKINEVSFYNDSISTIPQATLAGNNCSCFDICGFYCIPYRRYI